MEDNFNPDVELSGQERNDLASVMAMPGFQVILKLMKGSVDNLGLNLMNTKTGDDSQVIAKHRDWKVAGQFLTILAHLLNREKELYVSSIPAQKPVDSAEGLDIGEYTDLSTEEEPFA